MRGLQQSDTANVRQFQRRFRVDGIKDFFHSHRVGSEVYQDLFQSIGDVFQPNAKRIASLGTNDARAYVLMPAAIGIDDAEAGPFGPAVNSDYSHWRGKVLSFRFFVNFVIAVDTLNVVMLVQQVIKSQHRLALFAFQL